MDIALPLCGFLVGALVGCSGMGGGAVMTTLLILVFGLHPVSAVGSDLLFAAVTKLVGAREHARKASVDWRIVRRLALGSVPGALCAILLLSQLPLRDPAVVKAISAAIGVALLLAAAGFFIPKTLGRLASRCGLGGGTAAARSAPAWTTALGFALGVVVTLTSVGAGALGLAILRQIYPQTSTVRLVAVDIAHAVPLTLIAGSGHLLIGEVDWTLLALLLAGSIPGVIIGSRLAHRLPERFMRPALGALLVAFAAPLLAT